MLAYLTIFTVPHSLHACCSDHLQGQGDRPRHPPPGGGRRRGAVCSQPQRGGLRRGRVLPLRQRGGHGVAGDSGVGEPVSALERRSRTLCDGAQVLSVSSSSYRDTDGTASNILPTDYMVRRVSFHEDCRTCVRTNTLSTVYKELNTIHTQHT